MPEVLIEDINPYGTRRASLLAENGNLYFYLSALSGHGDDLTDDSVPTVSAVWVANLDPAAERLQPGDRRTGGSPPVMGRDGTAFPLGCPPLEGSPELVWFEEGDGVALLDADGLLAVIPGWGGRNGFCGYARYAERQTPLAWPLRGDARATLDEKVAKARAFWAWRLSDAWDEIEGSGLAHLDARIGPHEVTWRIDGGSFPEMIASRHRLADQDVWITSTTGLSAQRMPEVEQFVDDPSVAGRIEVAVARHTAHAMARDAVVGPASIPFSRMTWLGEGHIIDGELIPTASLGSDVAGILLAANPPAGAGPPVPDLSGLCRRGEPVTWLWVIAIDEATLALARADGAAAALDALAAAGQGWVQ